MNGTTDPVIDIAQASAELGGRTVLRGLDLTVRRGEVVALLGPNGSGKSTAVRTTVRQVPLTAGEVRLFGTPVRRFRDWHRVGYVPQRSTAAGGVPATVREVVSSGRLARRGLRPLGRADRAAVDEALALVGLADRASDPVAALSGGQHQRVLIARALAGGPELLIMDEPLAGVDLASQRVLADTLRVKLDESASVLLVLHELGPLRPLIDRAVILSHGRVERTVEASDTLPDAHPCHPDDALEPSARPALQTGIM
ncbi:metal ABC transporter ATP-binding protein [Streptomyces sp. 7-21]|uniref:metal ABC transporter ATP-binding protein n=1 Tax=Streptomyces sp. 7-21 TaxID=2802283 RepID=UPI00191FB500|nr:metal ABC transporter ATP-binding protein [Streptomyces sp. 7-21]MBL1067738.1 metal ABC transporter ATP-binding protein [Streptomyces sp. 7-21]